MISLKKKVVKTPVQQGLYAYHKNSMYQIRVTETHEVITAVTTKEQFVECAKIVVERYGTLESLKAKMAETEYPMRLNEVDQIRREHEYQMALKSDLNKEFMNMFSVDIPAPPEPIEEEKKPPLRRRSLFNIRLA